MPGRELPSNIVPYLAGRFELARVVLFTGAGFSLGARNIDGGRVPSSEELKSQLWELCFPGTPLESGTSLQYVYESARLQKRGELARVLTRLLTVDPESLPDFYKLYFSMPWARVYTLNIDDLDDAVSRRFSPSRPIRVVSAASGPSEWLPPSATSSTLDCIHINGTIADLPDDVTFSIRQYAMRLGQPDPPYVRLSADLLSNAFVFVGTSIDEPSLWQHIELRRARGGRDLRELRPRSYLVTPTLDTARQAVLRQYNVEWVQRTQEEFAFEVLEALRGASVAGHNYLSRHQSSAPRPTRIADVSELMGASQRDSDYLLGQEPDWSDLLSGRAIRRESDDQTWEMASSILDGPGSRGGLLIAGTAASGKSTALMRLAIRLVSEKGLKVGWIDRDSELSLGAIRDLMAQREAPQVLAIDDADLYGARFGTLLRDLSRLQSHPLLVFAVRSGRVDATLNPAILGDIPLRELAMPALANADIDALLNILDAENRLGALKGKSRAEQRDVFRAKAGRQLLVAMIEATSGRRFEEKIYDEFSGLPSDAQLVYAIVALATSLRHTITRDEILIATGSPSNEMLNVTDQLVGRKLIHSRSHDGALQARHRRIAEILVDELARQGLLSQVVQGLAFLAATKVNPNLDRNARPWRLLRPLLNHEFLARTLGGDQARAIYAYLEAVLHWDYHFWLQRGSLEVELGTVREAENFLAQAKSLASDDPFVLNEWAYLLYRKAIDNPGSLDARETVEEAVAILEELITIRGAIDAYPFHVLGSQGLAWARRGLSTIRERQLHLEMILRHVEDGCQRHPLSEDLKTLRESIQKEILMTTVPTTP